MNKFVYTKNELDVGIVERSSKKSSLILFLRTSERKLIKNKELKKINLSTTGDRYENKICDRCYKYLPTDEFPNNRLKKDPNIKNLEESISDKTGLNVQIKNNKRNKGSITFSYHDIDQLNKIIDIIKSNY